MQLFQALQMFPEPLGKLLSLIQGGLSIFYLRRYLEQGYTVPLAQFSLKTSQFLYPDLCHQLGQEAVFSVYLLFREFLIGFHVISSLSFISVEDR